MNPYTFPSPSFRTYHLTTHLPTYTPVYCPHRTLVQGNLRQRGILFMSLSSSYLYPSLALCQHYVNEGVTSVNEALTGFDIRQS